MVPAVLPFTVARTGPVFETKSDKDPLSADTPEKLIVQKTVIPPRTWVPVDLWLMANRAQRHAQLGEPASIAEVERVVDRRKITRRSR